MQNNIFYINGDSYSYAENNFSVYSKFLSEKLNFSHINKAITGSSNARIFRDTLEDCIRVKNQNITPYVILGLSFITREEVWRDDADTKLLNKFNQNPLGKFVTLDYLINNHLSH